jgi:uncharacterized protein YndB with AHSA1/START domain
MIKLNETRMISRSPGEVFAFLADLSNFPKWRANLVSFTILTEGPTKVGTRCAEVVQVGPMRATGTCDVTEFSPGRLLAFTATSAGIVYDGRIVVEPWNDGSKLTVTAEVYPRGPMKLVQPVLSRKLKSGIEEEASAVKELLERHVRGPDL